MNPESLFPPVAWSNYPSECLRYFAPMAVLHAAVFIMGSLALGSVSRREPCKLRSRVCRLGLFVGLFLVVGSLINGIWACLIYNHLYHSGDYIFDFIPFCPVTMNADRPHTEGYGTTLLELDAIWFAFAIVAWAITAACYCSIIRRLQTTAKTGKVVSP
jgi:hypothetical protein